MIGKRAGRKVGKREKMKEEGGRRRKGVEGRSKMEARVGG